MIQGENYKRSFSINELLQYPMMPTHNSLLDDVYTIKCSDKNVTVDEDVVTKHQTDLYRPIAYKSDKSKKNNKTSTRKQI